MALTEGTANLMQRLARLPAAPHVDPLLRGKPVPDGRNSVNRVRRGLVDIGHYRIIPYQMELATTCGGPGCPSNISVDNTSSTFLPRGTCSSVSQVFKS
jgi:hypothetical protein